MNATWVGLAVAVVLGLTKLLTYLLGDKRRLRQLREELFETEKEYAQALAKNDTVSISLLDDKLRRMRAEIANIVK